MTAAPQSTSRSRYPGTRPFTDSPDDVIRFFGRRREAEQLELRVRSVPLVVQFARSGLGKTSLLQAGLFPRLRKKCFLPVMVRLNDPRETVLAAVIRAMRDACKPLGLRFTERDKRGLWEFLSTTAVWRGNDLLVPVLVFDQFEEVFTLRDAEFRRDLALELGALAGGVPPQRLDAQEAPPRPDVKIVISLREDYLGALEELSASMPALFHERMRLEPLSDDAAAESIVEPARLRAVEGEEPFWTPPFEYASNALAAMIQYLKGKAGVIEPFQLQLLCRHAESIAFRKYARQKDAAAEPVTITLDDFRGGREFAAVLENFYRDTLARIPARRERKRAARLCEEGLLDDSGVRLMLEKNQIRNQFRVSDETLETLCRERLLRREVRTESVFYEISHDRLAESVYASKLTRLPRPVRRFLWAAAGIALLIVGGLIWNNLSVREAKARAERMAGFLLGEQFLGEVRDIGRISLLEQVQEKVSGQSHHHPPELRGLMLRNHGDILRLRGSAGAAEEAFRDALKEFLSAGDVTSREIARTHERLGQVLTDRRQFGDARTHYESAVAAWREVIKSDAATTEDCTGLALALVSTADLDERMGDTTRASEELDEALDLALHVLFGRGPSARGCPAPADDADAYPDATAVEVLSRVAFTRAMLYGDIRDFDGAAKLAAQSTHVRPFSVSARRYALAASILRGFVAESAQERLDDYLAILTQFDELRRWDPGNRLWERDGAVAEMLVSGAIVGCTTNAGADCDPIPDIDDAEAMALSAVATMRALCQLDPANGAWREDLVAALRAHAEVLGAQERHAEQVERLEQAEALSGTANGNPERANLLIAKAVPQMALKQYGAAQRSLQEAETILRALTAAHRDNPKYLARLRNLRRRQYELQTATGVEGAPRRAATANEELDQAFTRLIQPKNDKTEEAGQLYLKHADRAMILLEKGDAAAARRELEAMETAALNLVRFTPAEPRAYDLLHSCYDLMTSAEATKGLSGAERAAVLRASMYAVQLATWLAPDEQQKKLHEHLIEARREFGRFLAANAGSRGAESALAMAEAVVTGAQDLPPGDIPDARDFWLLGSAECELGRLRCEFKKAGWQEAFTSGIIHLKKAAEAEPQNAEYVQSRRQCEADLGRYLSNPQWRAQR